MTFRSEQAACPRCGTLCWTRSPRHAHCAQCFQGFAVQQPCEWCGSDAAEGTCPKSVTCPTCHAVPGARCMRPSGHPADELHAERVQLAEGDDVHDCPRCGQRTIGAPCDCKVQPAAHEAMQLFTPAAAQMDGQSFLTLD